MLKIVIKRKSFSKEHRKNLSIALTGKKHSKKTKEKMSRIAIEKGFGKWIKGKKHTKETKEKISLAMKGSKHHNWKGGEVKRKNKYTIIYNPKHPLCNRDNYIYEHRLIIEEYLNRCLLSTEVVHHINGIKDDNRIENLMLFVNHSSHVKFERRCKIKKKEIIFDGNKLKRGKA